MSKSSTHPFSQSALTLEADSSARFFAANDKMLIDSDVKTNIQRKATKATRSSRVGVTGPEDELPYRKRILAKSIQPTTSVTSQGTGEGGRGGYCCKIESILLAPRSALPHPSGISHGGRWRISLHQPSCAAMNGELVLS